MKRPPKIEYIPQDKIVVMKFRELKENGLIKKSWTKKPDMRLFDNLSFETLKDLEMVNETELKYNKIRENVVWYSQFGMSRKEAIERVAADFYISPKSINHILYRKIKK